MMEQYVEPVVEKIAEDILKDLVGPNQIGVTLVDQADEFLRDFNDAQAQGVNLPTVADTDFILLRRQGGYLDMDSYTDISGLDVFVFARTRSRAQRLLADASQLLLRAEHKAHLGFFIDKVEVLNGPNAEGIELMTDSVMMRTFEFHMRVKFID